MSASSRPRHQLNLVPTGRASRRTLASGRHLVIDSRHLIGREEEVASLLALLDAGDGLPAVAVVAGEAGIGKTALWLATVGEASTRGFRVISCRPAEAEARFSFSGLVDLLGGLVPEVLQELPGSQRRAMEAALALSDCKSRWRGGVAFAFLSVVRRLAQDSRLLLAVDDLQWLDAPSLGLLRYALPRLTSEPVASLLATQGEAPSWLERSGPLLELDLRPLSVGAIHELLRTRLDAALPRPLLLRVWETSGGNPFFALELARALERRTGGIEPGADLPLPSSLEALVHDHLDGLGTSALAVARAVAALAEPTVAVVRAAAGRGAERGLEEALAAGVLELDGDRLRFTHPLFGSAVSARSTPARRRLLHRRIAQLAPSAEERARHLALAATEPSGEAALALDEAAASAHARGAPAVAAELAEQALQLTPASDAEEVRRRRLLAAERLVRAGDPRRAIQLLEEALAAAPFGHARAAILVQLADAVWLFQHSAREPLRPLPGSARRGRGRRRARGESPAGGRRARALRRRRLARTHARARPAGGCGSTACREPRARRPGASNVRNAALRLGPWRSTGGNE